MYSLSAGTTAAEAGTACIFFWRGPRRRRRGHHEFVFGKAGGFFVFVCFLAAARRRLNGIDDEIYERADFHSTFSIATATTTANFRRDLL
jgi:hypothetical protein